MGRFDDGSLPAFPRCLAPNLQGSLSSSLSLDLVHPVRQTQSSHFRTDHLHVSLPRLQGLESNSNLWLALRDPAPARFSSQLCRWSRMARCSPLAAPAPATRLLFCASGTCPWCTLCPAGTSPLSASWAFSPLPCLCPNTTPSESTSDLPMGCATSAASPDLLRREHSALSVTVLLICYYFLSPPQALTLPSPSAVKTVPGA